MSGEVFDGTLIWVLKVLFLGAASLIASFVVYAIIDIFRDPPKKREHQHPEW